MLHIGNEADTERVLSYKSHRTLRETLEKKGIKTREVDIKWNSFDFQNYFEMASLILEKNPEVDGIMAADMPASAFLKAAVKIGKKVPEDILVAGHGDSEIARVITPPIPTVHFSYEKSGEMSVEMLIEMMGQGETAVREVKLGYSLINI